MRKSFKRNLSILLAILMLAIPMLLTLSSCKNEIASKAGTSSAGGEEVKNSDGSKGIDLSDHLPERDFGGDTFAAYIGPVTSLGLIAEEETGDIINDIVYKRNKEISERFNIKLQFDKCGFDATGTGQANASKQMSAYILANDTTYDVFMHTQHGQMPQMILDKNFVDWKELKYVDLSKPWWYKNILNDLTFGDKVYTMTGDYGMYISSIDCLIFNKDIFDELGEEYPYQKVLDGKWTYDEFSRLVAAGKKDLNGDGLMSKTDDRWGLCGWGYELDYALLVGLGFTPLTKDSDNMPVLNTKKDTVVEIYDKIINLYKDDQNAFSEYTTWANHADAFKSGRSLFYDSFLSSLGSYRDVEFDFGILPFPKLDESQDSYHSRSSNMTNLTYIPITNDDLEKTGIILEALACASYKELTPAYFDIVLTVKNTRDVESEKMLPIIRDSARFLYNGYTPSILGMVQKKQNTYASEFAANESTYATSLNELITKLKA